MDRGICLCCPGAPPGTPPPSSTVGRALRLIREGVLDRGDLEQLAERLDLTSRHLRRLFVRHLGATPSEVARTRRLHFARVLLDDTQLACDQVARAAGYGSVRRFNADIRRVYHRTPSELRRRPRRAGGDDCYRFRLAYRPPYNWEQVLGFLAARATPGVETIRGAHYRRAIRLDGTTGTIDVSPTREDALALEVRVGDPRALLAIVERVRLMFDLGADPAVIRRRLGADPWLAELLHRHPGVRIAGAWDACELIAQALLGRGLAVTAGPEELAALVAEHGTPLDDTHRLFPTAAQLCAARQPALRALAAGTLALDDELAAYVQLRVHGEPDVFPGASPAQHATWRPWRSYAAMLLAIAPA